MHSRVYSSSVFCLHINAWIYEEKRKWNCTGAKTNHSFINIKCVYWIVCNRVLPRCAVVCNLLDFLLINEIQYRRYYWTKRHLHRERRIRHQVKNNTHLKGDVIDSKARAEKNKLTTGTLTWENMDNKTEYKAKASGITASTNAVSKLTPLGLGYVPTVLVKGKSESTTLDGTWKKTTGWKVYYKCT